MLRSVFALLVATGTAAAAPAEWAEVEPIPGADALAVIGDTTHVIAKINGRWFVTDEPLGEFFRTPTFHRAFDASLLAKQPAIAVVIESYDGGSEMGTSIDELVILCAEGDRLRKCGEIQIGHLEWVLGAEHRTKYAGAAYSLRKRPHVEVVLEPTMVAPDMLRLRVTRDSTVPSPDGPWDAERLEPVDAVRKSAGLYRLVNEQFVRVN